MGTAVEAHRRSSQEDFKSAGSKKKIVQTESRVKLRRVSSDKPNEFEVQSKNSEVAVNIKCKSLSPKVPSGRNEKIKKAQDLVALNKKLTGTGISLVEGASIKQAENSKLIKLTATRKDQNEDNFQQEYQEFLQSNNNTER